MQDETQQKAKIAQKAVPKFTFSFPNTCMVRRQELIADSLTTKLLHNASIKDTKMTHAGGLRFPDEFLCALKQMASLSFGLLDTRSKMCTKGQVSVRMGVAEQKETTQAGQN